MSTSRSTGRATAATLEPGYLVALTLQGDAAPLRAYVGEVQAVDERGVRLTLVDWLVGSFCSWDLFAPWDQITSALIATPEHDVARFEQPASRWQSEMGRRDEEPAPRERSRPRVHAPSTDAGETPARRSTT
jgi:hypothetical protein